MTDQLVTVDLPPSQLVLSAKREPLFPIRESEWKRLRAQVEELRQPMPWLNNAAWAVGGFGLSAVLAWIAWTPAEIQLSSAARVQFAFVAPLLLILGVACLIVGVLFIIVDRRSLRQTSRTVDQVLREMDDLHSMDEGGQQANERANNQAAPHAALGSLGDSGGQTAVTTNEATVLDDESVERFSHWSHLPPPLGGTVRDNGNLSELLRPGDRIGHSDFGQGTVRSLAGSGHQAVAEVYFDVVGRKRLLVKIAPIKPLFKTAPIPEPTAGF